jgi:hypothetical protein
LAPMREAGSLAVGGDDTEAPPTSCVGCGGGMHEAPVRWGQCGCVCVLTPTYVYVNPTQVCVNPTQVCVLTLPRCWTCEGCYWRRVCAHLDVDKRSPLPDAEPRCPL